MGGCLMAYDGMETQARSWPLAHQGGWRNEATTFRQWIYLPTY